MVGLLALPSEMRNSIYGLLLTSSPPKLNLLAASRMLHEEAASYFYQNNAFAVDLVKNVASSATVVPPISDKYLRYLRTLTVNIKLGYDSPPDSIERAERLAALADHSSLTSLTLNLTSAASTIVSRTTDDCVLHASHPLTLALRQLLSRVSACSVRVNLNGVWFAPGVGNKMLCDFQGSLTVTSCFAMERMMQGQVARDHMREFGLDEDDVDDAEDLQRSDFGGEFPSLSSPLKSALLELDAFSPTEYQDEGIDDPQDFWKEDQSESCFDEPMFDADDREELSEDELTEDDDIDAAMEDIDNFEAIVENLADDHCRRVLEHDICYMINFAPNMLRSLREESV